MMKILPLALLLGLSAMTPSYAASTPETLQGHWVGVVLDDDGIPQKTEVTLDRFGCFAWKVKGGDASPIVGFVSEKAGTVTLKHSDKSLMTRFHVDPTDARVLIQDMARAPSSSPDCCKLEKL